MGLLLLQMGLLLLGLRRAQACSEAAPATAREVYVVTRTVLAFYTDCAGHAHVYILHVHCKCRHVVCWHSGSSAGIAPPRHAAQRTRGGASCATVARPHVDVSSRDLFI